MQNPVSITAAGVVKIASAGENTTPGILLLIQASGFTGTFKPQLRNSETSNTYTDIAYTNRLTGLPVTAGTTQSGTYTMEIYGQPYRDVFLNVVTLSGGSLLVQALPIVTPSAGAGSGIIVAAADVSSGTFGANIPDTGTYTFPSAVSMGALTATTGTFSNALQGQTVKAQIDQAGSTPAHFIAEGNSNTNQQLLIGYNTTSDFGSIQAIKQGTSAEPLQIQPLGGLTNTGGDFSVATSKFTASSATGNVTIAGSALLSSSAGGLGYTTGAGSSATQATSKATAFTLNTITGQITFSNSALLGFASTSSATWTCSAMQSNDRVQFQHISGGVGHYVFNCTPSNGQGTIWITNVSSSSLSEAPVVTYNIMRGSLN